jgi:branched-chain amino acid transport system substrate-binding protein
VVRKRYLVLLLALAVVALAQCTMGAAKPAKQPYVIGAIFSLTGDNAPLGVPERETVEMLAKQVNAANGISGHPVKVIYYDDEGKPEKAVKACQDLLANKDVIGIIGPTLTGPSLAIATMCQDAKMPLVSCAASIKIVEPVKPYVFKTAQTDSLAVAKLIDYMKKAKIKTVGFIYDSNAFGASGREQWMKLSVPAGIKTLDVESFNTPDTDMTAQLTKIRAANPQAVICWGTNPGPAVVARNMRTLGMKQKLLMSHGIANMTFIKIAGTAADGVIFPAGKLIVANSIPKSDRQRATLLKYAGDFQKTYGKPTNTFGGHAYDAFMLVVNAAKAVGPNHAKIRDKIEKTKGFIGISGIFNMTPKDHNGVNKDVFALVTIKNGKWVLAK